MLVIGLRQVVHRTLLHTLDGRLMPSVGICPCKPLQPQLR